MSDTFLEVPCATGDGTPATTLVGVCPKGEHVVVELAATRPFTISLQVDDLVRALRDGDSIGVPCLHAEYGERLLGVNPHLWWEHLDDGPVPMELYLLLPDDQQLEVVFTVPEVALLISALTWASCLSTASRSAPAPQRGRGRRGAW